jgi:quinol-cytochrome oxidoreductase complex cytochrome b subunit
MFLTNPVRLVILIAIIVFMTPMAIEGWKRTGGPTPELFVMLLAVALLTFRLILQARRGKGPPPQT